VPGEGTGFHWPVLVLKQRLVDQVKWNAMASTGGNNDIEEGVATDSKQNVVKLNSDLCFL